MTRITGEMLAKMSPAEIEELYKNTVPPTNVEKELARSRMDTGIYDKNGNLIGDKCEIEDMYEE